MNPSIFVSITGRWVAGIMVVLGLNWLISLIIDSLEKHGVLESGPIGILIVVTFLVLKLTILVFASANVICMGIVSMFDLLPMPARICFLFETSNRKKPKLWNSWYLKGRFRIQNKATTNSLAAFLLGIIELTTFVAILSNLSKGSKAKKI